LDLSTATLALVAVVVLIYVVTVVHAATVRVLARQGGSEGPEASLLAWPRWLWALVAGLLVIWLLSRVRGILLPFVMGAVIAYLLNPGIDALQRRGWRRAYAIGVVFGAFLVVFVVVALLVVPTAAAQAEKLAADYQTYAEKGHDFYQGLQHRAKIWGRLVGVLPHDVSAVFAKAGDKAQAYALNLLQAGPGWLNRSLVVVSLLIITPVVTFWLLLDYHALGRHLMLALPEPRRETTREILRDINQVAGGYLLGTAVLAGIVALYAVIVLTVARVPFSILLGLLTGLLYVVPYIGYPSAVVISGLIMVVNGKGLGFIVVVLAIMVAGNLIADQVLYPKLVGRRVGLHPLTAIFALLAGGTLLGFAGVVLAVPAAAVIKVVMLRFWPQLGTPTRAEPQAQTATADGPAGECQAAPEQGPERQGRT
jgi:predicted PurR-regulated permease PerM